MSEDHKKVLEQQLWKIAELLRGKMNASEYQNYILGFIFYKGQLDVGLNCTYGLNGPAVCFLFYS